MNSSCPVPASSVNRERRGLVWLVGSFVICPCHLPITLAVAATVFSGTAVGAVISGHPYIAGIVISLAWLAGTWRGVYYLRSTATKS